MGCEPSIFYIESFGIGFHYNWIILLVYRPQRTPAWLPLGNQSHLLLPTACSDINKSSSRSFNVQHGRTPKSWLTNSCYGTRLDCKDLCTDFFPNNVIIKWSILILVDVYATKSYGSLFKSSMHAEGHLRSLICFQDQTSHCCVLCFLNQQWLGMPMKKFEAVSRTTNKQSSLVRLALGLWHLIKH